ncbi:copper amine oxidase N-terminal domain-containing protein, partial [bacterium]|nr:copper amine oxidase N-terminal domain-containing protein [bacterium]
LGSRVVNIYAYNPNARYGAGHRVTSIRLNTPPIICGSRVFAPVRAAVEAAGGTINYNHADRSVSVRSPRQ